MPHREQRINQIANILAPAIRLEKPSNIFIYGKTGTGKSLVCNYVTSQLANLAKDKGIPVKTVYINCKLRKIADTEYRLVAHLARHFGRTVPATGLPTDEVYRLFYETIDDKEQIVLIVLDEIDKLISKCGDEILYNFTRISQELKNAEVSLIGISNDLMFIDNIDARVRSSLNEEEIIFPPYDALQLKDILAERAKIAFNSSAIDELVISKCAAYAAREHGDARRALDLLRVAGEIAERQGCSKVEERHVDMADEKIEHDRVIEVIKSQPTQSKVVLYSIIETCKNRKNPIYTGDIFNVYIGKCTLMGERQLTQRRISDLITELDTLGLINAKVISMGRGGRKKEISLAVPQASVDKIMGIIKEDLVV
ncbi:MAG: ORC1-type DNA replication protein [Candidatus Omnitrophica bacterium]|nr:ORC1-type DNA replication protein [Candidatus Omnitrophota bacterium]